ncbi:MAG: hypothetical protein ACI4HK_06570 [Ruminococcus sp.]
MKFKQIISAALSGVMLLSVVTANAVMSDSSVIFSAASADEVQTLEDSGSTNADVQNNIQNGGFESPKVSDFTTSSKYYQFDKSKSNEEVPHWKTTAYGSKGNNGKIEMFIENNGVYINTGSNRILIPPEGSQAAELNADEASTLYQYINTSSGSLYEWGLYHRGRSGTDTMALIIGPKQFDEDDNVVDPAKPSKTTQDQFMQMVEWLKNNADEKDKEKIAKQQAFDEPIQVVVYSKPFAAYGKFKDENTDIPNFSLEQTNVYTEEWHIWIIRSDNNGIGRNDCDKNGWKRYGKPVSTQNHATVTATESGESTEIKSPDYCKYTVPEGSNASVFAFVAYESGNNNPTYGNLIDGINFDLYHPSSTTANTGGTGRIDFFINKKEDYKNLSEGEQCSVMVDDNSTVTITATPGFAKDENGNDRIDGDNKRIQNHFVGAYVTINGEKQFIKNDDDNFVMTIDSAGYSTYKYVKENVSGKVIVDLYFTEVYTVTFLSNGGVKYNVSEKGTISPPESIKVIDQSPNVARYIKDTNGSYTTAACEWKEPNAGVEFVGWELLNYSDDSGNPVIFDKNTKIEYYTESDKINFNISDGKNTVNTIKAEKGAVFLARWLIKNTVYAQTEINGNFVNSTLGGTVSIDETNVEKTEDTEDNNGKYYYTSMNKQVTVTAEPNEGYEFVGWYNSTDAKMITPNRTHTCDITDTSTTVYARFRYKNYYTVRFHINDEDTKSTSDDVFRTYYSNGIPPELGIDKDSLHLEENKTIKDFYNIPTTTKDGKKTYKVFKGWYLDKSNNADSRPIKWNNTKNSTKFESSTDVYAHWIAIDSVPQDSTDNKIISGKSYKTFDLFGTQIRNADKDPNYPNGTGSTPAYTKCGLRFVTSLGERLIEDIDALNTATIDNNYGSVPLEYGYVIAKKETADNKEKENGKPDYMLEYKGINVNGENTTSKYSYVQNIDCTSKYTFTNGVVPRDHFNCDNYRIYSLVISYENSDSDKAEAAKNSNVIARSYIRYTDANGLLRTYYNDYTGTSNKYGGCSTSFNTVKHIIQEKYTHTNQ